MLVQAKYSDVIECLALCPCFVNLFLANSRCRQPQDLDVPAFKVIDETDLCVPHSQTQSHRTPGNSLDKSLETTVHFPKTNPVRSGGVGAIIIY